MKCAEDCIVHCSKMNFGLFCFTSSALFTIVHEQNVWYSPKVCLIVGIAPNYPSHTAMFFVINHWCRYVMKMTKYLLPIKNMFLSCSLSFLALSD